ncbi:hypothetical protein A1Q2_05776 [Trichosporon asahii var. asahii CBS 8904]|uniref:Uncharacterized protein n=2 Tax=Trichosporon asahii var. asahii TaxID=189963 RepID=K1VTD5_TRIAC|nr:hypothetical protein A1Q1_05613 [Trichosporon asahii var. asahii CBS 2479]EJT45941.1 hypothetical protein A1Q1_05613 [Trichosporon asahii var. asahii CBS 2479]EKC99952.1 hypothetical protein A1Q2_05776 [Trichosporon asahii var. asahii CBS 8904]
MSAHPMSPSSSASSSSAHSNSNGAIQQQRQYVLEVAPPMPQRPSAADEEIEVISFGSAAPKRKTERAGSFPSQSRDPFKVRDGLQPRKASSGVYTPNTFPGARSETSSLTRSPSNVSTASSQLSPPPMCNSNRASRLSGLKRISVGFGHHHGHGHGQQRNSVISSPTVVSVPSSLGDRALTPVARQASSSSGHTDRTSSSFAASSATDSTGRRYGHSPTSSTHSASSISPPATPTTPTESKAGIVDPNNSSPDLDKASSSSSPTGPKRTRRKPVPQMDVDLITRLERLEMESK